MSAVVHPADVLRFRHLVSVRMGLLFEDDKLEHLGGILRERLDATGSARAEPYLSRLSAGSAEEVRALAQCLTVGETYFFRHADQLRAFAEVALPERARLRESSRRLRILSAGCASGEEPYTLSILVREHLANAGTWDVRIHGIDLNPSMIEKAVRARYSTWSLRETPEGVQSRYFHPRGRELELEERVRACVTFEERNLLRDDPLFWEAAAFDIIFCRNVTMYFTPDVMRSVIARLTRALVPGGFLFLGHAETLRGVCHDHHLRHTHDSFYYQRRDADSRVDTSLDQVEAARASLPSLSAPMGDAPWVDVIQGASDRIARLSTTGVSAPRAQPADAATQWDLRPAVEMLRQERFADAMGLLQELPAASRTDADAQLLRAVILTNGGKLAEAEGVCQAILASDELHAGAHYLTALCREHAGERDAAVEHDQVATYLDPSFAMPHVHLGLLARRAGDAEGARAELQRALALLVREDASRILLYGGGFRREALLELCQAELRRCEGEA